MEDSIYFDDQVPKLIVCNWFVLELSKNDIFFNSKSMAVKHSLCAWYHSNTFEYFLLKFRNHSFSSFDSVNFLICLLHAFKQFLVNLCERKNLGQLAVIFKSQITWQVLKQTVDDLLAHHWLLAFEKCNMLQVSNESKLQVD